MACTTSGAIWWSGDAVLPAVGERVDLGVGGEAGVSEATEQAHHREVELAMATVGGGIDEPAVAALVDEPVARPEVAVQTGPAARRRHRAAASRVGSASRSRAADARRRTARRRPGRAGRGAAAAAFRRTRPRSAMGSLGRPTAARRAPVLPSEARRCGLVQAGQRATELGLGRPCRPRPPRSTRGRGRVGRRRRRPRRRAPRARGTASAAASQRSPLASVVKNPAGGLGWVLAKTRRPSSRSKREGLGDVAASHDRTTRTALPSAVPTAWRRRSTAAG